jgi:hypothetical protein
MPSSSPPSSHHHMTTASSLSPPPAGERNRGLAICPLCVCSDAPAGGPC